METRELVINNKIYAIMLPTPRKAMPLCTRLAILLGALLPTLMKNSEGGMEQFASALKDVNPLSVDSAFMDAVNMAHLCCNNEPISTELAFDKHFTNYRNEVYQVCIWTLWECVKDFFPQLGTFTQGIQEKVAAFQSQTDGQ